MQNTVHIGQAIVRLLEKEAAHSVLPGTRGSKISFKQLSGDGSSRKFFRVTSGLEPICIAVLPPSYSARDMAEFRAASEIGRHLENAGLAVPKILAVDEKTGLILFEDFGDIRLHDVVTEDRQQALDIYRQVVSELAHLQVGGARGFNTNWCYDTAFYNTEVMLDRESGYFLKAFWQDMIHAGLVEGLAEEFEDIAAQVMNCSELLFLHRDFQSRNIMVSSGRIAIIDFQAGRLGPPGYDLASLLIDPYADLSDMEQQDLFSAYIDEMMFYPTVSIDKIKRSFPYLAVQRNLQIIGAFAYLSGKMQKPFFKPYILPSLLMLRKRLRERLFQPYGILQETVSAAITRYLKMSGDDNLTPFGYREAHKGE